jgi:uncharacterized protein YhaN
MRSKVLVLVLLALAAASVLRSFRANVHEIARARAESRRLASERDSLHAAVRERDERQLALAAERDTHRAQANRLRDSVRAIERRRAERQVTLRHVRTVGALQDTLRAVFPELGETGWGLTTVPLADGDTLGIEVLLVPAWFAETFAIDHRNAESWRAQKEGLLAVDSLQRTVARLQDSISRLEQASRLAYQTGYRAAYAGYRDLSQRYHAKLRKPRVTLSRSIGLVAAVGAGVVLGVVIR